VILLLAVGAAGVGGRSKAKQASSPSAWVVTASRSSPFRACGNQRGRGREVECLKVGRVGRVGGSGGSEGREGRLPLAEARPPALCART
jgi:hypothetical protein